MIDNEIKINDVEILDDSNIVVSMEKQSYVMETPYVLKFQIQKEINGVLNKYDLPNISLGISGNTCYIYTVQQPKTDNNEYQNYAKKIKRLLYKVNQGVISNYDDEILSIDKVSPSAIVSLSILFTLLNHFNINKIKVVPFLPIRYQNKTNSYNARVNYLLNSQPDEYKTDDQKEKLKEEYEFKQMKIQNNLTQKLIMDFYRLQFHFNSIQINSIPMELSNNMYVSINGNLYTENILLSQIVNKTRQSLQNKVK